MYIPVANRINERARFRDIDKQRRCHAMGEFYAGDGAGRG